MSYARLKQINNDNEKLKSSYWEIKLEELKTLIYTQTIEIPIMQTWWKSNDNTSIKSDLIPLLSSITVEDYKAQNESFKKIQKELIEKQLKSSFQKTLNSKDHTPYNIVMEAIEVYASLNSIINQIKTRSTLDTPQIVAFKELDQNIRRQIAITQNKKFAENKRHLALRRRIKKLSEFTQEAAAQLTATKTPVEIKAVTTSTSNPEFWIAKIEELQKTLYEKAINDLLVSVLREGLHEEFRTLYIPQKIFSILEKYNPRAPLAGPDFSEMYAQIGYITRRFGSSHGYALHSDAAIKFIAIYGNLNWIKAVLNTVMPGYELTQSNVAQLQDLTKTIADVEIALVDHIDELFDSFDNLQEQANIFNYIKKIIEVIANKIQENWINSLALTAEPQKKSTPAENIPQPAVTIDTPKQKIQILKAELQRLILDDLVGLTYYSKKYDVAAYQKPQITQFIAAITAKVKNTPDQQNVEDLVSQIYKIGKRIERKQAKLKQNNNSIPITMPLSPATSKVIMPAAVPDAATDVILPIEKKAEAQPLTVENQKPTETSAAKPSLLTMQLSSKKDDIAIVTETEFDLALLRTTVTDINSEDSINYKIKNTLMNYIQNDANKTLTLAVEAIFSVPEEPGYESTSKITRFEERINNIRNLAMKSGFSPESISRREDRVFFAGLDAVRELTLLDDTLRQFYIQASGLNNMALTQVKTSSIPEHKESSTISYKALEKWASATRKHILQVESPRLEKLANENKLITPSRTRTTSRASEVKKVVDKLPIDDSSDDDESDSNTLSQKFIEKKPKPTFHQRHKGKIRWGSLIVGALGIAAGFVLALTPSFGIGQLVGTYLIYQGFTMAACAAGLGLGGSAIGALTGTMAGLASDCCCPNSNSVSKISQSSNSTTLKHVGGYAAHTSTEVSDSTPDARAKSKVAFDGAKKNSLESTIASRRTP